MAEPKTKKNSASATDFINSIDNEQRRKDSKKLLSIYRKVTGLRPVMWGTSIVGFGEYYPELKGSGKKNSWPLAGFSPRKQNLSLYVMPSLGIFDAEFAKLGKHSTSLACLYLNKLSDVDEKVLEKIIKKSYEACQKIYG